MPSILAQTPDNAMQVNIKNKEGKEIKQQPAQT